MKDELPRILAFDICKISMVEVFVVKRSGG